MSERDRPDPGEGFATRWSRRKVEAREPAKPSTAPAPAAPPPAQLSPAPAEPLPPVESLTPESDFARFLQPDVEEGVKRQALRKLFSDPHFNVMDGLDVYIDDFSKPDPIPESWYAKLNQMKSLPGLLEGPPEPPESAAGEGSEGVPGASQEVLSIQEDATPTLDSSSDTVSRRIQKPLVKE